MGNTRFSDQDFKRQGFVLQPDGTYKMGLKEQFDGSYKEGDPRHRDKIWEPTGELVLRGDSAPNIYKGTLLIDPLPTSRPRLGKYGVHNPPKYTAYKKALIILIKQLNIPKEDWAKIECTFFYKFTKGMPQYKRIDNMPRRVRPDVDNLGKAVLDAMEQAGVIKDDGQMHTETFRKKYTFTEARIEFTLST